jgi:hypothetical protein
MANIIVRIRSNKLDVDKGMVFILRRDGYSGTATTLESGATMVFG